MSEYIALAKQSRSKKPSKEKKSTDNSVDGFMMVTVGRMTHDGNRGKAKYDKSFKPIKIPIHGEAQYEEIVKQCCEVVWGPVEEDVTAINYYLADGSGVSVRGQGHFELVLPGNAAKKEIIPWTLKNYLKVSRLAYPSRARLYIVKGNANAAEREDATKPDIENSSHDDPHQPDPAMEVEISCDNNKVPDGYFSVTFLEIIESGYTKSVSFRYGASQHDIVTSYKGKALMMVEDDDIAAHTSTLNTVICLYSDNPLEFGYFLDTINFEDTEFSFIGTVDCESGIVTYKQPNNDDAFTVWTGCYTVHEQSKALLCCVAINGFHSCAVYMWTNDDRSLAGETPLLYCSKEGVYRCTVRIATLDLSERRIFRVFRSNSGRLCVSCDLDSSSTITDCDTYSDDGSTGHEDNHEYIDEGTIDTCILDAETPPSASTVAVIRDKSHEKSANELAVIKDSLKTPLQLTKLDVIGSGSFGKVYKAIWRGTIVAAKEMPLSGNEKALRKELDVYRSLQHPNVLSLLGVEVHEGSTVLIMNLVNGQNLNMSLFGDQNKAIKYSFIDKMAILKQVAQGMVFMHTAKPHSITHLDLKPANILVTYSGLHVYIADFGVSYIKTTTRRTTQTHAGTPGFQSPEQLDGTNIGPHCDVYAFGCVALELLSEKPIWEGLSSHAIMCKVAVKKEFPPHPVELLEYQQVKEIFSLCLKEASIRGTSGDVLSVVCNILLNIIVE